jgi:hypothetical protein
VLHVKVELLALIVSAAVERVKAGACAPPLARLAALTRSPSAEFCPPCFRRRAFDPRAGGDVRQVRGAMAFRSLLLR